MPATASIPASQLVNILPSVLSAGGNPLSLNSVFLTGDASIPQGTVQGFPNAPAVEAWFGPSAQETLMANAYFGGFTGATQAPGVLYFAPYNLTAVAAYVRGASVASLTLAQIQALTGVLDLVVNGEAVTSASINLAGATSQSNAASLITTGLDTGGGIFSGTGSTSGSSTTLTIASTVSGALHVGDVVVGTGIAGGTTIASFGTYTVLSGVGTVILSASATVASSAAITVSSSAVCTYDTLRQAFVITSPTTGATSTMGAVTGSLAAGLFLSAATGAVLSQGAAIAIPATTMASVVAQTQNWAGFTAVTEPSLANKLLFAAWVQTTNQRFFYVNSDSHVSATQTPPQSSTFAAMVEASGYNGCVSIYDPLGLKGAFFCGMWASVDFDAVDGSITSAYKNQAGLIPDVTDAVTAQNLLANGYSFYGAYATANEGFQFFQNGQISGSWDWADEYIEQIYFNSQLQLALVELMSNVKQLPYNQGGYNLVRAACLDPINQFLAFGGIQQGVVLSAAQQQEVNTAAGLNIATTLSQQGWYLLITDPGAQARANRSSPNCTLWYVSGGSIQVINLASINVQ